MPNPLDQVTEDQSDPPLRRVYINGDGMPSDTGSAMQPALSPDNRLVQAVAPPQDDIATLIAKVKDRLLGTGGQERYQTWPERMVREGLTAPGDVLARTEPSTSESLIEPAMATSALAGGSALAERPGAATLGSGPVRPGMKPVVPTEPAPVFYSALEHATTNAAQDTMSPQQWLGYLKNQPGVKKEELDWTGLEGWLGQQKEKVRKEDVQTYLDAHKTEIKDVTKGVDTMTPADKEQLLEDTALNLNENEGLSMRAARRRAQELYDEDPQFVMENYGQGYDRLGSGEGAVQSAAKYSSYQLPGGENYREHLLTLPPPKNTRALTAGDHDATIAAVKKDFEREFQGKILPSGRKVGNWEQEKDKFLESNEGRKLYDQYWGAKEQEAAGGAYMSSHWDEPNVLAHVRTNDRTMPGEPIKPMSDADALAAAKDWVKHGGEKWENVSPERQAAWIDQVKKVAARKEPEPIKSLHIEEIQSDWHQQGRKQGYKTNIAPEEAKAAKQEYGEASYALEKGLAKLDPSLDYRKIGTIKGNLFNEVYRNATPTDHGAKSLVEQAGRIYGPEAAELAERFVKATAEKRRTDMASDAGVPDAPFKTTWPELALKRMIRHAAENGYDRISWTPGEAQAARYDLSKSVETVVYKDGKLTAVGKNGQHVINNQTVPKEKLADFIGKEAAEKLVNQEPHNGAQTLQNADLKVGGEGMREFYDKMLPKMAEKVGKAHGVKVKQTNLPYPRLSNKIGEPPIEQPVHYFDLPQSLKDHAVGKGFPLYMSGVPFPLTPVDHDPFKKEKK